MRALLRAFFALLLLCGLSGPAWALENGAPPANPIIMTDSTASPVVSELEAATRDLQMPSETDAPFQVVFYPAEAQTAANPQEKTPPEVVKITPEAIAKLAGAPADAKVETRDLEDFFAAAATEEDWMEDEEKATAKRFANLVETLKKLLQDPQVVLWGEAKKQVAIVGQVEGGCAGVLTVVVET